MKPTNFAKYLMDFLTKYLVEERGCSSNTIAAYRDTMVLLLNYFYSQIGIPAEKVVLRDLTKDRVISFLGWLEKQRNCSVSTRNARLAAIHSFFRFLQYRAPEQMEEWQQILSIKVKKCPQPPVQYLTEEGIRLFLSQPDPRTAKGMRDMVMLTTMVESGARVQEIIDLTASNVHFGDPTILYITGKGNKTRRVPFSIEASDLLNKYLQNVGLLEPHANGCPLFGTKRHSKISRMGITAIVKKYAEKARRIDPVLVPEGITPHSLRHSKAMLMMKAGVNLIYIRDFLGHQSVTTTEIYARIDNQQKLEAINKVSISPDADKLPSWQEDKDLLHWLENLGK